MYRLLERMDAVYIGWGVTNRQIEILFVLDMERDGRVLYCDDVCVILGMGFWLSCKHKILP